MSILGRGRLRNLNLGSCHALSGKVCCLVFSCYVCIECSIKLSFTSLPIFSLQAAAALKRNCAGTLETLDMSFVRGVPEDCFGVLVDSSESLKALSVWGCTQLTAKFFNGYKSDILQISGRMAA
jgi:hypothetical protein